MTMPEAVSVMAKGWLLKIPNDFKLIDGKELNHSFLLPGLDDACQVHQVETSGNYRLLRFRFFDGEEAVSFVFIWGEGDIDWDIVRKHIFGRYKIETNESESATDGRFMLCSGKDIACAETASRFIRSSDTLGHEKGESLDRGLHLLTEPRGFACYSDQPATVNLMFSGSHDLNQFERFAILFALGLAYREVMIDIIGRMANALAKLEIDDGDAAHTYAGLASLRESIVMFDARHYYHAPVRPERQELFAVSQLFMDVLHVHPLHEEMAQKLGNVSRLADHKLEAIQQAHRETLLVQQQQAAAQHERKMGRLNVMLALMALLLTTVDLLSHSPSEWMLAIQGWLTLL